MGATHAFLKVQKGISQVGVVRFACGSCFLSRVKKSMEEKSVI